MGEADKRKKMCGNGVGDGKKRDYAGLWEHYGAGAASG